MSHLLFRGASFSLPLPLNRKAVNVCQVVLYISSNCDAALSSTCICVLSYYPRLSYDSWRMWEGLGKGSFSPKNEVSLLSTVSISHEGMKKRKWVMFAILSPRLEERSGRLSWKKVVLVRDSRGRERREQGWDCRKTGRKESGRGEQIIFQLQTPSLSKWPLGPLVWDSSYRKPVWLCVRLCVQLFPFISQPLGLFPPLFSSDMEKCPDHSRSTPSPSERRKYNVKLGVRRLLFSISKWSDVSIGKNAARQARDGRNVTSLPRGS